MSVQTRITVSGERPYDVTVGHGLGESVVAALATKSGGTRRIAVIHPGSMRATGSALQVAASDAGHDAILIEVPDAEEQKTSEVAAFCWSALGQAGFTRTDAIVGVGGGATTDLAGFVGATWLRGVDVVQVPTTLLAMVDAAVGGKTGINTAEGKNLVGAIWPPTAVFCDLDVLSTLPRNDLVAGMAEVVKAGFIRDVEILRIVESDPEDSLDPTSPMLRELIERAIQVKADVVGEDLHESLDRELGRQVLNYGHTFGHAIELVERYSWRHGAAVSVGMMYVAELARLAGRLSENAVERHRAVLTSLGLPTTYPGDRWDALLSAMARDKKTRGALLRFVVLEDIARPVIMEGPDPSLLAAAYQEIAQD